MRILILALAGTLVLLQARLWISDGGLREVWRLTNEVERRTEENGKLAARNAALEAEVEDLFRQTCRAKADGGSPSARSARQSEGATVVGG